MTGVRGDRVDMLVYISASHRCIMSVLSPTRLCMLVAESETSQRSINLRLVVALSIGDSLFAVSTVGKCMADVANIPFIILEFLQNLDPHIRNGHGKAVVESNATKRKWQAECWHTRDILSNGNDLWVEFMQHFVCKHHIDNSLLVNICAEVLMIATGEAPVRISMIGQ